MALEWFGSGCACCGGMSRRQFLGSAAAGVVAAPSVAASVIGTAEAAPRPLASKPPAQQGSRSILLKGGCVLTMDKALGDFEEADILIEGKKIVAVRPNIEAPGAQLVDCYRNIVMPGFVDTHRHMWQGFLRNVLPDGSLMDYIQLVQRKFGANFAPEDVYAALLRLGLRTGLRGYVMGRTADEVRIWAEGREIGLRPSLAQQLSVRGLDSVSRSDLRGEVSLADLSPGAAGGVIGLSPS